MNRRSVVSGILAAGAAAVLPDAARALAPPAMRPVSLTWSGALARDLACMPFLEALERVKALIREDVEIITDYAVQSWICQHADDIFEWASGPQPSRGELK